MENVTAKAVERVYRRVLAGESLDNIETSDGMRQVIWDFTKYSAMPACQISQNTGIPIHIALVLRDISHRHRKRLTQNRDSCVIKSGDITFAVRHLLHGDNANIIKSFGISDDAIRAARKCIKTLDMGGGTRELYKIGVSHRGYEIN